MPRRDGRPASRPRHVRPSVQCSMHLDSRPRNRRRRRRRRTHYVETTKPMAGPVRAVRACVCTAAPVLTHHQLERVSWRANDRARSSVVTHLLVRVICAKSPIPRCHHATTAACMLARCWSTLIMRSRGGPRYADFRSRHRRRRVYGFHHFIRYSGNLLRSFCSSLTVPIYSL